MRNRLPKSKNQIITFDFVIKFVAGTFLMYGVFFNLKTFPSLDTLTYNLTDLSNTAKFDWSTPEFVKYVPSMIEKYIIDHSVELGYDKAGKNPKTGNGAHGVKIKGATPGCLIWKKANSTPPEIHGGLLSYEKDLANYNNAVNDFKPIPDLLKSIRETESHDVCATARPHPDGIQALFPSNQLSLSKSGFIEPLTPPMRDHRICYNLKQIGKHLMSLDYLVHDFEAMCRRLKPWSKRVLIDMGASFFFHGGGESPIIKLIDQYEKFGFVFDHIYGFEITKNPPQKVYDNMPEKWMSTYHWINVGVSREEGHKLNPLHSILKKFGEDDFVVIKLDIDTSFIEIPLARQLLEDKDGVYHKLVDQFYFEHHVRLPELARMWRISMNGTVKDSLDLFYGLREKGIPAHFWP